MNSEFYFIIIIVLLFFAIILSFVFGKALGKRQMFEVMQDVIEDERKDAIKRSRSVLTGQFSEQISPFLPNFPIDPSVCRFIGKPVDFIGFVGLDEKKIDEVVFVEVKTGKSQLNSVERSLKDAIKNKRVRWVEYRI